MADNKEKLYGYVVDKKFFNDKISALDYAGNKNLDKVKLYFLDDQWKNVCWTKEPTESFQQLVETRCKQIREQFNTVSLFFSGGYDSTTILNGFINTGSKIDELIFWRREWIPYELQEFSYAYEIGKNIKKDIWPSLKLTLYTRTVENEIKFYKKLKNKWIQNSYNRIGLAKNIRNLEFEANAELRGKNKKNNHIYIEGRDKPRLDLIDDNWYATMNDDLLQYCMYNSAEQFYFSPSFPELHVKQCHMMISWLEKNFQCTHDNIHQLQSHLLNKKIYEQWNLSIGRNNILHTASRFGEHKNFYTLGINSYENSMLKKSIQENNLDILKIWQKGIQEIKKEFSYAWNTNNNNLKTIISKQHYIKKYDKNKLTL
jgi:hypothetical protein